MDNDTRRFSSGDPARVDGQVVDAGQEPVGAQTTHLSAPVGVAPGTSNMPNRVPPTPGYVVPAAAAATRSLTSGNGLAALVLIGLGLFFLLGQDGAVFGAAIPLAIGLIFLYVYQTQNREYGFLIPGAILTGLGAGIVLSVMTPFGGGGFVPLGLGIGFLTLWATHRDHWWWLIPGSIVSLAGMSALASENWPMRDGVWIPLLLIVLGLFALMQRRPASR